MNNIEKETLEKQREMYRQRLKERANTHDTKKPNHKYVKSFQHFINIVNSAIEEAEDKIDMSNVDMRFDYYYNYIYLKPFCDQYTWLIRNERPDLLMRDVFAAEMLTFQKTNKFCGKTYSTNKVFIEVPDHLKDK